MSVSKLVHIKEDLRLCRLAEENSFSIVDNLVLVQRKYS